jgi:hypothetical protein
VVQHGLCLRRKERFVQSGTTRGPGKACFHILRRNSTGNLGNKVNFCSVSEIDDLVMASRLEEDGWPDGSVENKSQQKTSKNGEMPQPCNETCVVFFVEDVESNFASKIARLPRRRCQYVMIEKQRKTGLTFKWDGQAPSRNFTSCRKTIHLVLTSREWIWKKFIFESRLEEDARVKRGRSFAEVGCVGKKEWLGGGRRGKVPCGRKLGQRNSFLSLLGSLATSPQHQTLSTWKNLYRMFDSLVASKFGLESSFLQV